MSCFWQNCRLMKKNLYQSPNYSKIPRNKKEIKFVIIHYTGMQSEIESIDRLSSEKSKVSCHYLINKKGKVIQMVKELKVAWHAGKSKWQNYKNLNKYSIGIELVNKGHKFGYEKFPNSQIRSLIKICKSLKKKYHIPRANFLGHSDIAPLRKIDPGEKFPWKKLSYYKFGIWHKIKKEKKKLVLPKNFHREFFRNLFAIGYRYFKITKRKKEDKLIIKAFQQRYLPKNVSGIIDSKTLKISHFLANYNKLS